MEFTQKFKQFRRLQYRGLHWKHLWTFLLVTEGTNLLDVMSVATTAMRMMWHYKEPECLERDISFKKKYFNTSYWKGQGCGARCLYNSYCTSTRQIRTWQCFVLGLNKRKLNLFFIVKHTLKIFFLLLPNQYSSMMHKLKTAQKGFFLLAVEDFPATVHSLSAFVLQTYSRSLSFIFCSEILPLFQGKIFSLLPAVSAAGRVETPAVLCPVSGHCLWTDWYMQYSFYQITW